MRLFVIAILLFSLPSPAATDKQKSGADEQHQSTTPALNQTSPVTVVVNQPTSQPQKEPAENKLRDRDNGLWPPIWSNWALILVAALGAGAAFQSLGQIKRQAKSTEDAAKAASDNALAVVNAERAWIMVNVQPKDNWIVNLTSQESERIGISALLVCRNEGKSIAWITEKWANAITFNTIPENPDFSDKGRIQQRAVQPIAPTKSDSSCTLWFEVPNIHARRKAMLLYGYVKYRTIFENRDGETRFGYIITPMNGLDRLPAEYPEYNRNT